MPVNYNAFNVDPLRYQQAAMGNFANAMQIRNQNQQAADRNALAQQQQADLQGHRQATNAFNERQQTDLQGQRQATNALTQQQIDETAKRTEVYQKNAKINAVSSALNLARSVDDPEERRKIFSSTLTAAGYGDEFGEDSPYLPSFETKGIDELPIGKGQDGLPQGFLSIKGKKEDRKAFTEEWGKDPSILEDQQRLMMTAQKHNVEIGFKKGWSAAPKEPKALSVADKKFEAEKWKELDNQYVSNYAQLLGVKGDEKEGYYYEGEIDENTGEPKKIDAGKDVAMIQKRARRRTAGIKRLSRLEQYAGWDIRDLEYEYDQMVAQEEDRMKREAALGKDYAQRGDLKAPKKEKKVKAKSDFSKEGAENPISKYINEDMGSSWTFGKSASEIAAERRRRANQ